jgi:hypothetical protein
MKIKHQIWISLGLVLLSTLKVLVNVLFSRFGEKTIL